MTLPPTINNNNTNNNYNNINDNYNVNNNANDNDNDNIINNVSCYYTILSYATICHSMILHAILWASLGQRH